MRFFRTASSWRWAIFALVPCLLLAAAAGVAQDVQKVEEKAEAQPAAEKKQADKAETDAEKKPSANPLQKFIRNIFGGAKPNDPPGALIPAESPEEEKPKGNGDETARDHIDTRAPFDTRQASRLRKATALIKDAQHSQAAEWLQLVLDTVDEKEDSVVRLPGGQLESVRAQANRLLSQFPPAALDKYRQEHGPVAQQLLLDAQQSGNPAAIAEVADKYFHTPAGQEAANYLGTQHIDRGEFGPAARRFLQLLEADAPMTRAPAWRLKAAVAFREAGLADGLDKLRSQLDSAAVASLSIGGDDVQPQAWLDRLGDVAAVKPPQYAEWQMLYGSPQRTGTAVGGDPLLLERWYSPLTYNREISDQVEMLLEDLSDQNRAPIFAWHALATGNKVVFRTLRGVQVVDADTGQPLWETRAGVSAERLLTGQPAGPQYEQQLMPFGVRFNNRFMNNYGNQAADQHPLTGLLLRNGTFGLLSSHENRLFVIEDHAILSQQQPGYFWGGRPNQNDPYRRDWSSNKLAAYDLADGRPLWEVGGPDTKEPIQLPLAGTYFFGAPTPAGGELFAVGEKDNEVRLFSLNPETGEPNWSQMLAVSETRIDQDFGRRWWPAQVAVGNGVVVCPTTLGWLVAVDRTSRAILWAYRYSVPNAAANGRNNFNGRQLSVVQNSTFNQRWCPSAPIIVGNRVLYTPSEYTEESSAQTAVVCLNLSSGERLWQKPKEENRYLAGVFNQRAVIVGANSVTALALDNGAAAWTRPIPNTDGSPSGFGVAVGDRYYLPLNSGQLWTIDLASGKVVARSYLADRPGRLGNLTMYRGMLLSLSPLGLTSFEQRDAVVAEIRGRLERDPLDAWSLLREADMHVLNREFAPALALLRKIPADRVSAEQEPHFRRQMIDCLTHVVRSDFHSHSEELQALAAFAQRPDEQLHVRQLTAEQLEARKQYEEAFAIYRTLAAAGGGETVGRTAGPHAQVLLPLDLWLGGRMRDVWAEMGEESQAEAGAQIEQAAQALGDNPVALEQFVSFYDFHPAARAARQRLAAIYAARGEVAQAQGHLLRLSRSPEGETAAAALLALARMLQERQLTADALYYYAQLAERYPDVEVADGTTARALYDELQAGGLSRQNDRADRADWGRFDIEMQRTGANYSSSQGQDLDSRSFRLPYFRQFRFEIDGQQKLAIVKVADGELHWLVPLRGKANSSQHFPVAQAAGHRLFVLYRDVLHCLSPVERKLLWTHTLEVRGQSNGYYFYPNQQTIRPMQTGQSLLSGQSLVQRSAEMGMLAVANSSYVCLHGRRKFTVIDAGTGEVRWTRDGVPAFTRVVGNEDLLFMVPQQDRNNSVALRASDGKLLDVDDVSGLLAKSVHISQRGLVLVENDSKQSILGLSPSKSTVIRLHDPLAQRDGWQHSFPNGAYFTLLEDESLAALREDGSFALLDLESGRLTELGRFADDDLKSRSGLHVVADRDNVYLFANQNRRSGSYYSLGLPFVRADGAVFAFDRRAGRQIWKQTLSNQNLVLNQFEHSPVMTFATRTYQRNGQLNVWSLNVVALDKATGRKLVDARSPFNSSFRSVDVNLADRYVELRSYNDRIRLIAVDRPANGPGNPVAAPLPQ